MQFAPQTRSDLRLTDRELIERIRRGDGLAERDLFAVYGESIDFMVYHRLWKDYRSEWQDVAADIKMALLTNLREGRFDPDREGSLAAYISAIVQNQIRNFSRALIRERIFDKYYDVPEYLAASSAVFEIETLQLEQLVQNLVSKLSRRHRSVFELSFYQNLKPAEISTILGLSSGRVSELLYQAKKRIAGEIIRQNLRQDLVG